MRRGPTLNAVQSCILEQLQRVQFATNTQFAHWCNVQAPAISKAVQSLLADGLIDGSLLTRPMILQLTGAGANILNTPLPSGNRHSSWSVMAHACHKNAFEIQFAKQHPAFRFVSRLSLLKQGFNPAHGEHAAIDADKKTWFVLLDDYMMGSDRISRSWTRRHTPNTKYWPDLTGRAWNEIAHHYLIVTTDQNQKARHEEWIEKNAIPGIVEFLPPLWKT